MATMSIEKIRAISRHIKERRQRLYEKLENLQKTLSDAHGDLDVSAQTENITLDIIGADDYSYGYLCYSQGKFYVAYRTTEEDLEDSFNAVPSEHQSYSAKEIADCRIEWLEKLTSEKSINSLLKNLERNLEQIGGSTKNSLNSLDQILESYSNIVSDNVAEELKEISDGNLHRDWLKARDQIQIDPSDSLTRTSSYLETICRKILDDLKEPLPKDKDITSLVRAAVNTLELSDDVEANTDLKQLFGSLRGIFQAIGKLRTHFGTAHGMSQGDFQVDEHHARLASDAAAAASGFLLHRYKIKLNR